MKSRILNIDKPGSPGLRWGLGGFAVVALASAIGYGYFNKTSVEPQAVVLNPRIVTPPVTAYPTSGKDTVATRSSAPNHVPLPVNLTKSQQIDMLLGRKDPADAFAAYTLIRTCVLARHDESEGKPARAAEVCGDITPGQVAGRMQPLEMAAAVGVPNAYQSYLAEGPSGNGFMAGTKEEQKDPLVASYFKRAEAYQEAAAKAGDAVAAYAMFNFAELTDNRPLAVTYWVAQEQMARAQGRPPTDSYEAILAATANPLTPEQRTYAIRQGQQIALQAQTGPYWSRQ